MGVVFIVTVDYLLELAFAFDDLFEHVCAFYVLEHFSTRKDCYKWQCYNLHFSTLVNCLKQKLTVYNKNPHQHSYKNHIASHHIKISAKCSLNGRLVKSLASIRQMSL